MSPEPHVDDANLKVDEPEDWAAGVPGVLYSMGPAVEQLGIAKTLKLMTKLNHKDGFDCMSCAWPDPDKRKVAEFCENGAKAVTWEATPLLVESAFWAEHPVSDLQTRTEYWLGQQGRLKEPVYKPRGADHYEPISWDRAFAILAERLTGLSSPDEAVFYTSGRTSNEAAFAYQLFVRAFGTNNLPDCSNMCHESTSLALSEVIGVGKSTISYDDMLVADLIVIMGQNPGTNHPRMLTALEDAKANGAKIVAVNPLPEAGLKRYKNPQRVKGVAGRGTEMADQFLQIRLAGDMALLQAIGKRVLEAEDAAPGTVLDRDFIDRHTSGFDEWAAHVRQVDDAEVLLATGLGQEEIDELADRYIHSERVIVCWAMGITQHRKAVDTIKEITNLQLLRGNIGRQGAGLSPIRGHSNVQGDRTMGIWEQMADSFLDRVRDEFGFEPPREHGVDSVKAVHAMRRGDVKFFMGMGGNLVSAISDTQLAEPAFRGVDFTVQVSTKLNRSHAVVGDEAMILPTLGRTEIDVQPSGPQFVSVEDTVCSVHGSHGQVPPVAPDLMSEVAIVARLAHETLGDRVPVDWMSFLDYDVVRDHISRVVPGFEDYPIRVRSRDGFVLPHGPRDSRTFPTETGKAMFTANDLEPVERPEGTLLLQTVRAHDQFNTTIYSLNDRYRGIHKGRNVLFVHPDDVSELGLDDGQEVDVHGVWDDGVDRVLRGQRIVAYPTARGCAAAYFPEANVLVPLESAAIGSNCPTSKAVLVRLAAAAPA